MSIENLFLHSLASHTLEDFVGNATFGTDFISGSALGHVRRSIYGNDSLYGLASANGTVNDSATSENLTDSEDPDASLSSIDENLAAFIHAIDICLAFFSGMNLVSNIWLLILCVGFVKNGCSSSSDTSERRPHYGLHLFIFNCAISSVFLETIGALTNIGYLYTGQNVFILGVESPYYQHIIRKTLDFLTYGLFNVTHLNFVLLLNVDKLLYILRPLHYHEAMSRRRVCMICIGCWAAALAMASPSLTYVEANAQLRQESILFAMCVVCPASFDLLSAIIVATIVFRIQLQDSSTRRSVMGTRRNHHGGGEAAHTFIPSADGVGMIPVTGASVKSRSGRFRGRIRTIRDRPGWLGDLLRHLNVFLRTFTPIIWTCVTTLPYVSTMIYLYFGSDGDEEFIRRWTDDTTFRVLRAFGCLYITYFTGVPFIIVFNYYPYRRKIKAVTRLVWKRLHGLHRRVCAQRYHSVAKHEHSTSLNGVTSTAGDGYVQTMATVL